MFKMAYVKVEEEGHTDFFGGLHARARYQGAHPLC
jgi:hypothetical protein